MDESRRKGTHSLWESNEGTRASDGGASKLLGALPNNLAEVQSRIFARLILILFTPPHVDRVGDVESTSASVVLCKFKHKHYR